MNFRFTDENAGNKILPVGTIKVKFRSLETGESSRFSKLL